MLPSSVAVAAVLLLLTTVVSAASPIGLDSFLNHQLTLDPNAATDPFLSLPSPLKSSLSSSSPLSLLSLSLQTPLHVTLIGPRFATSSPDTLSRLLSATSSSNSPFHVITPSSSSLSISHSLSISISISPTSLSQSLTNALSESLQKNPSVLKHDTFTPVPYSDIDIIVNDHHHKQKPTNQFHLYVLDLDVKSKKKYAYSYGPGSGESSPGSTKCSGSIWAGKDRYLWVDLGATWQDYGPALSGDRVVPRGGGAMADLASLIHSAYKVLLVPPLRVLVPFENALIVHFIHVYDGGEGKDSSGLDFNAVGKVLTDENGLLIGDQTLKFRSFEVEYQKCSICSFAVTKSLTMYTSRYLFDNYTLIVSEYLDSKRLHLILSDSAEEVRRVANIPEEDFGRVLPVYVFDLNLNSILLLDRYHQTVSFKDMVVGIRTKSSQTVSDYSCGGRHVFTQTRELERPLVGSILQSMWGVSPTHLLWSEKDNKTLVDYTWSLGQTPFGPFSDISSLSFVQRDAARRNTILTYLNSSITSMVDVLESLARHGGDRKVLKPKQYKEFIQRWNLYKYKLDKVVTSLSHMEFDRALYFMRSSDHDMYAIHSIVYEASQELEASLACFKDPPFPWGSALFSGGMLSGLFYAYLKRDRLFRNKRKQF